jgi:hypothetical protein
MKSSNLSSRLLIFLFLTVIFVSALFPIDNPDTGFNLATGKYVAITHSVPLYDVFSYTGNGARLIAHYWLSDLIFYLFYVLAGYWGVIIIVALMAAITYGVLFATAKLHSSDLSLTLFLMILFSAFTTRLWPFWIARPQIFGYLMAALMIFVLEKWRLSGNRRLLWWLFPIFLLWANMHASVILGILIVMLYAGVYALKNILSLKDHVAEIVIMAASLFVTLVNPNGYKILTYSFYIAEVVKQLGIFEWQSIIVYLFAIKATIELAFIIAAGGCILALLIPDIIKRREIKWEWLALTLAAIILPLLSVRHTGFFPILVFPIFVALSDKFLSARGISFSSLKYKNILMAIFGFAFLAVYAFQVFPLEKINSNTLPVGATDFILREKVSGPIFNTLGDGGYLMWALWPEYKVFFDGRSEVYIGTPADDYQTIMQVKNGWENLLDNKYKINVAILSSIVPAINGQPVRTDLILAQKLVSQHGFKLVYWDDASMVIVRNVPQNKKIIDEYGYKIIGPYNAPQYIPAKESKEAATEIYRALKTSPNSSVIASYAREFMVTH